MKGGTGPAGHAKEKRFASRLMDEENHVSRKTGTARAVRSDRIAVNQIFGG